jgi:hypothetical protein
VLSLISTDLKYHVIQQFVKIQMSPPKPKRLAIIATVIVLSAALSTAGLSTIPAVYADGRDGGNGHPKPCDSTDVPPFKELPDAAGATGNPHTCQQPTGDPHLDPDNNPTGNPHNT